MKVEPRTIPAPVPAPSKPAPVVKQPQDTTHPVKIKADPVKTAKKAQKIKEEPKEPPAPSALSPPPKVKPSGLILALSRLAELEEQLAYAYAKHVQLIKTQERLKLQTKVLEKLPVGIDAIREELDAAEAAAAQSEEASKQ